MDDIVDVGGLLGFFFCYYFEFSMITSATRCADNGVAISFALIAICNKFSREKFFK